MVPATLDWLCYAVLFALSASLAQERKRLLFLVGALAVGGAWAAISGAMEYGQFVQSGLPGQRAQSPFFSPNFLAGFLGLTLPVVVALFLGVQHRLAVLGLGVVSALMGGVLAATGSRSGIALAIGGLGVAFLLALIIQKGKLPWVRSALLLVAVAVLGFAFRGPLVTRGESGGQEHSGDFRKMTWQGTQAMAQANPILGAGPGTFPYLYPRYATVARTDLAHSSYLQLAAEQGYPALILTVLALGVAVGSSGWEILRSRPTEESFPYPLLACGLLGGVLVGIGRGVFDSEWSLLGNGIPFWATAGAFVGLASTLSPAEQPTEVQATPKPNLLRFAILPLLLGGLMLALLSLQGIQIREGVKARLREQRPDPNLSTFPPDPSLLYWQEKPDEAARIEPTGKRFYQLGRVYEAKGEGDKAIEALRKSVEVEPNSLQAWRKLAEVLQQEGKTDEALTAWRELVQREEGAAGQIRAIPELRETHAAFAYFALGQAVQKTAPAEAEAFYEKAMTVIDQYSQTPPVYQQMEVASAVASGASVEERRQGVRDVCTRITQALIEMSPQQAEEWGRRRDEILARIEKFIDLQDMTQGNP
jgi:O-antigen ligase/tetratricopeptide (TPR) repeat protein